MNGSTVFVIIKKALSLCIVTAKEKDPLCSMGDLFPCGHGKPCPIHSYDLHETAKIQRIQIIAVDK
jgi:hypothetical protein